MQLKSFFQICEYLPFNPWMRIEGLAEGLSLSASAHENNMPISQAFHVSFLFQILLLQSD